jgi:Domain of unknown function (DUF4156)
VCASRHRACTGLQGQYHAQKRKQDDKKTSHGLSVAGHFHFVTRFVGVYVAGNGLCYDPRHDLGHYFQGKVMKIQLRSSIAVVLLGYVALSGCTWVESKPGASGVTLVMPTHVTNCKPLGTTISQVKAKIGIINRSDEKVAGELLTLARNSAVEVGGDTLVAEGEPSEGTQKFKIYKCR